jgi:glucose-1-phosphate thymidylyltransferase
LILGDNIFFGGDAFPRAFAEFKSGATIFAYHVTDPERYGVVEFDAEGKAVSLEEKPAQPRSNYAVPGVYLYDNEVVAIARAMKPSPRGELEITDVNKEYLRRGTLRVQRLSRGTAWLDAGTSSSLHEASAYVQTIEKRQGMKLGCPEEAALYRGFLTLEKFESLVSGLPKCEYRDYLADVATEVAAAPDPTVTFKTGFPNPWHSKAHEISSSPAARASSAPISSAMSSTSRRSRSSSISTASPTPGISKTSRHPRRPSALPL